MNRFILLSAGIFFITYSPAQNSATCDSLSIDCCSFITGQNSISLVASNYSSYLFDYPGFILYDGFMDTVAIEEVNYFGIGTEQTHVLDIVSPIDLPFEGILELYTFFYDTLWCTYEVYIPDTVVTTLDRQERTDSHFYPNPAHEWIMVEPALSGTREYNSMIILDIYGRVKYRCQLPAEGVKISAQHIGDPGIYFLSFQNQHGTFLKTQKLIIY